MLHLTGAAGFVHVIQCCACTVMLFRCQQVHVQVDCLVRGLPTGLPLILLMCHDCHVNLGWSCKVV